MRKVNKLAGSTDHEALFAQGVAQIIAEKTQHPTNYRDYELNSILRKERAHATLEKDHQFTFGTFIADVQNAFVWKFSPLLRSRLSY